MNLVKPRRNFTRHTSLQIFNTLFGLGRDVFVSGLMCCRCEMVRLQGCVFDVLSLSVIASNFQTCLGLLMHYPPLADINSLLQKALFLRDPKVSKQPHSCD